MSLFRHEGGIMDAIRCDEPDYLIWKWRPQGAVGRTNKENAIRWGSSLTVKEGSLAVFVYKGYRDFIIGPYGDKLSTGNLPVLAPILSTIYGGGSPFQAEVYFINLAQLIQVNFAVPYFDVFDTVHTEFAVPVAVRGTISFKIADYYDFIDLHRLDEFDLERFRAQIKNAISKYVKSTVMNAPEKYGIPVIHLEKHIIDLDRQIGEDIKQRLDKDFAVSVTAVDIGAIDIDKTSDGYNELMRITKHITSQRIITNATAEMRSASASMAPPPIPQVLYHVAQNGQQTGPFDMSTLAKMASDGKLNRFTLVWKPGMANWEQAGKVDELKEIL